MPVAASQVPLMFIWNRSLLYMVLILFEIGPLLINGMVIMSQVPSIVQLLDIKPLHGLLIYYESSPFLTLRLILKSLNFWRMILQEKNINEKHKRENSSFYCANILDFQKQTLLLFFNFLIFILLEIGKTYYYVVPIVPYCLLTRLCSESVFYW